MGVNYEECVAAGLDPDAVVRVASKLEKVAADVAELGLTIFACGSGGRGSGNLRIHQKGNDQALVVAELNGGRWDGGDGAVREDEDGLLRGE